MENIIKYITTVHNLKKKIKDIYIHNGNKYKKDINKILESFDLSYNKKEFYYHMIDEYEKGVFNGTEKNQPLLYDRYRELTRLGHYNLILTDGVLDFCLTNGYCSKISSIFSILIEGSLIYLKDDKEEESFIDDKNKIFEFIKNINIECEKRLNIINSILGKDFYGFERKIRQENKRIYESEKEEKVRAYLEENKENIDNYLKGWF